MYEKPQEHFPKSVRLIERSPDTVKFSVRGKPRKLFEMGWYLGLAAMGLAFILSISTQEDWGLVALFSLLFLGVVIVSITSLVRRTEVVEATKDYIRFGGKKYDRQLWGGFGVNSERYVVFTYGDQPHKFPIFFMGDNKQDILSKMNDLVAEGA